MVMPAIWVPMSREGVAHEIPQIIRISQGGVSEPCGPPLALAAASSSIGGRAGRGPKRDHLWASIVIFLMGQA